MRFAFYVDTPFHLMNCVNFVWNNIENSRENGDLYLLRVHEQYPEALTVLRQRKLFKNIYFCKENPHKWFMHDIIRSIELLFPERAVRNYCPGAVCQENYYDVIMTASPTPLVIGLIDLNKSARIWLFSDGSGSYFKDFLRFFVSAKTHLFYRLFRKGVENIKPERLYISHSSICQTTANVDVRELPWIENGTPVSELLFSVFGGSERSESLQRKFIFLSQPFQEIITPTSKEKIDLIFDYLKTNHAKDTIVRKHPREQGQDYRGLDVAKSNPMWELFCMTTLSEEQTLISIFSTAQLTPKLLFDKEPILIFLYNLIPTTLGDQRLKEIDAFVRSIRDSYRDKNRIHVPKTMQEFMEIL